MSDEHEKQAPDRDMPIVQVATAGSEVEAMMWRDSLANVGITAMIRPGGPGMGAWASVAAFEHAIYVREDKLEEAGRIIERMGGNPASPPRGRRQAPRVNRRSLRTPG